MKFGSYWWCHNIISLHGYQSWKNSKWQYYQDIHGSWIFTWQRWISSSLSCVHITSDYFGVSNLCISCTKHLWHQCEDVRYHSVLQQQQQPWWHSETDLSWVSSGLFSAAQVLFGVYYQAVILSVTLLKMMLGPPECKQGHMYCTHSVFVPGEAFFFLINCSCFSARQRDCCDWRRKNGRMGRLLPGRAGVKLAPANKER